VARRGVLVGRSIPVTLATAILGVPFNVQPSRNTVMSPVMPGNFDPDIADLLNAYTVLSQLPAYLVSVNEVRRLRI
jgi:hypothetical protein